MQTLYILYFSCTKMYDRITSVSARVVDPAVSAQGSPDRPLLLLLYRTHRPTKLNANNYDTPPMFWHRKNNNKIYNQARYILQNIIYYVTRAAKMLLFHKLGIAKLFWFFFLLVDVHRVTYFSFENLYDFHENQKKLTTFKVFIFNFIGISDNSSYYNVYKRIRK